jgi:transposase
MGKDILTMSQKELVRLHVIKKAIERSITQKEASKQLGLSERQVRRQVARIRQQGDTGILHAARGRPSLKKISEAKRHKIIKIYQKQYWDFGPTLAVEKLKERQNIILSKETLRKWLIEEGLRSKQRKSNKHRQKRERKRHFGDMVQIDGSHHDWLEGRGPKLVLMGYIDDATNKVYGCFYEYEGTIPAIDSLEKYIRRNGIPMSVYVDQHSTYKTQDRDKWRAISFGKECLSQFERTCKELSITVIHAHSPQAKGRVERLFRTLQDRLVKEFRLSKINTLEQANRFLQVYLKKHNQKFSLQAYNSVNMHRKVKGIKLPRVMCIKTKRRVRNDFTIAHNSTLYQIKSYTPDIDIEVREKIKGRMEIWDKRKSLKYKRIVFKNRIGSLIRN